MRTQAYKNSGQEAWRTPPWLFERLHAEFDFQVDAAAARGNALCGAAFSRNGFDGTEFSSWRRAMNVNYVRFFLNPPFNNIPPFLACAAAAGDRGATVVCLLPARVEVAWMHDPVYPRARELRFIRGRVRYYWSSREGRPNFASMVVVFGPRPRRGPIQVSTIVR